jgi:hypothetical protein
MIEDNEDFNYKTEFMNEIIGIREIETFILDSASNP